MMMQHADMREFGGGSGAKEMLLAQYALGQLRAPAHAVVEAHLDMKRDNRRFVADLERLAADTLDTLAPVTLTDRDARLDAIFNAPALKSVSASPLRSSIPRALQRFSGTSMDQIPWKSVLPGFREWEIGEEDGCDIHMFWIKPGRKMPTHTHEGTELFLVLEGSFTDESGYYGPGDISIADEHVNHRPVAGTECACIGFSVTDAPLRLTGSLSERLGMLFGR
jgi:putative transcriptional regulator